MPTTLLLDKEEMTRILERLACEVLERHGQCDLANREWKLCSMRKKVPR